MTIRYVCLFDIDGTLIASGGAGKAALETALAAEHGIEKIMPKLRLSGRTDVAICKDLLEMAGLSSEMESIRQLHRAYLQHLPDSLSRSTGSVLPGIGSLLEDLSQREDVLLGLLTGNLREGAKVKLGHFGLDHYFRIGGFGDHHLDRDDVAREAWSAIEGTGANVQPEQVWVLGDTPLDVQCARAIGANVVAVATGWHSLEDLEPSKPDLLVESLADPHPFLRLLSAG